MIELKDIYKTYHSGFIPTKNAVLKGLDLHVNEGEVYAFLGANGSGKTTAIKILVNLHNQDSGIARIKEIDVSNPDSRRIVGYLPEQPYFYSYLTGYEFLDYCGQLCDLDKNTRKKKAKMLLEKVGLKDDMDKAVGKYSRGMLQRIGIAQALINDPDVLILDEPLSGLDPLGRSEIIDIITEQKESGKTIFFSSHILADAETICDRVGILNDGKIVTEGSLKEVFDSFGLETSTELLFRIENVSGEYLPGIAGKLVSMNKDIYSIDIKGDNSLNDVVSELIKSKAEILAINEKRPSLEHLFLEHIKNEKS